MILPKSSCFVAAFLAGHLEPRGVRAHGYLKTPRSRNYVASLNPVWSGGSATDPAPENCPHCLNIGGTEAQCGKVGDHNYDHPTSAIGGPLAPVAQACYAEGAVIDVESVLTAHHKGHFELKGCPVTPGEVPTQACFDAHKLTFVEDVLHGAPPDPLYPERAYIPLAANSLKDASGNYRYHHRYKLPEGLRGDLVLLQWYYVTANSCAVEGYDTYNFPPGFDPTIGKCTYVAPDGRGLPEQFWNCAEVRVTNSCGMAPSPSPPNTPSPTRSPTSAPSKAPVPTGVPAPPTSPTPPAPTPPAPSPNPNCATQSNQCSATVPCANSGDCCSQWGYCGTTASYCGECCQGQNCWGGEDPAPLPTVPTPVTPPAPSPTPPTAPVPPSYSTDHGEDSRLIAYVGNWQECPTEEQVDNYSHMVIAFAVSYTWSASKNACDNQCNVADTVPICENQNRQDLVDSWKAKGKKVILSFGGAGMGGSWSGDNNNCWDYCFGKEEALSAQLTNIISNQNFDGIDIDYEYCYDVAGKQAGKCPQRTSLYSDAKAQTFLDKLTSDLRVKLDALQAANGYDRGRYEITHAPMDSDLVPSNGFESQYFRILKDRRADLDFLMPQFYNGVTRPGLDGVDGTGAGSMSAAVMFSSLANDLFDQEPHKVVFGFCISDCSGTGSNISSDGAAEVMFNLKAYNNDEFMCNGGAFFWVASHDSNGSWSNSVAQEVSLTAGCSVGGTPSPTASPTNYPTYNPTSSGLPTGVTSSPTSSPSKRPSSSAPVKAPTAFPTKSPTHQNGCVAIPQDQLPAGQWATTDEQCKLCESGSHPWWPCDTNLCNCSGSPTPQDPAPAPVNTPPAPNPSCAAHSNQCSATNPCAGGLCCSQWGYCGSEAGYCGNCCQSGNCWV